MFDLATSQDSQARLREQIRKDLAAQATTPEASCWRLMDRVNALAEAEGKSAVYHAVTQTMTKDEGTESERKARALEWVTELLAQGPDDAWSGRGNDARRAYFDGILAGYRDVQHYLRRA